MIARMVALGLAVIWPRYGSGAYDEQQNAAQAAHAGGVVGPV